MWGDLMAIVLDFLHYYRTGERRPANSIAYQYDVGRKLEVYVPTNGTYEINYFIQGMALSEVYAPNDVVEVEEGYKITANIPNIYLRISGELRVYVVLAESERRTTYEGYITIRNRPEPDDTLNVDPTNEALSVMQGCFESRDKAEAWAVGQVNGVDVHSDAPQYHNNAKYYADVVTSSAETASNAANTATNAATTATNAAESAAADAAEVRQITANTIEFTEAETRENISSGEPLRTMLGKIKKWFTDLKDAAFHNVANDLTETESGSVLDARQGKILDDKITALTDDIAITTFSGSVVRTDDYTTAVTSIPANSTLWVGVKGTKEGYEIVGVCGYYLSGTTGATEVNLYQVGIARVSADKQYATFAVRTGSNAWVDPSIQVTAIWKKAQV